MIGDSLENNRKSSIRIDTSSSGIQIQFTDRNTHSSNTEIPQAEDTGSISNNDDLWADSCRSSISIEDFLEVVLSVSYISWPPVRHTWSSIER
jgi:hypothetical protein